jgi:hypothetical protein
MINAVAHTYLELNLKLMDYITEQALLLVYKADSLALKCLFTPDAVCSPAQTQAAATNGPILGY